MIVRFVDISGIDDHLLKMRGGFTFVDNFSDHNAGVLFFCSHECIIYMYVCVCLFVCLFVCFVCLMVFNATFNNISVIS